MRIHNQETDFHARTGTQSPQHPRKPETPKVRGVGVLGLIGFVFPVLWLFGAILPARRHH
jgi:hypothetical protein